MTLKTFSSSSPNWDAEFNFERKTQPDYEESEDDECDFDEMNDVDEM